MSEIPRDGVRPEFWENVPMDEMSKAEWEALCDGCGKCCLNKLEDDDTGHVELTRISCRLLDVETCLCAQYPIRHQFVPECIVLKPESIDRHMYWLPQTCAYRLIHEGRPLYPWHPLLSGDPSSPHGEGVTMIGKAIPETEVDEDDWEDHIIEEPT